MSPRIEQLTTLAQQERLALLFGNWFLVCAGISMVGMQHNLWVDRLLAEFKQFGAKVACADVPPQTAAILWEYAAETTAESMVEGFSRVRKCTELGRACMSLDLQ
eukprot:3577214-Pyramimonas_sp.AAC.2